MAARGIPATIVLLAVTVLALLPAGAQQQHLQINLTLSQREVYRGAIVRATVTIYPPAPPGGLMLHTYHGTAILCPPTVFIGSGATSASFDVEAAGEEPMWVRLAVSHGSSSAECNVHILDRPKVSTSSSPATSSGFRPIAAAPAQAGQPVDNRTSNVVETAVWGHLEEKGKKLSVADPNGTTLNVEFVRFLGVRRVSEALCTVRATFRTVSPRQQQMLLEFDVEPAGPKWNVKGHRVLGMDS